MNTKMEFTLEGYLTKLANSELTPSRPFDTNREYQVVLGSKAQAFVMPQMKIEYLNPPRLFMIRQFYHELRPLLKEIRENEAFLGRTEFGKFSANDIAKAYLFNTLNKKFHSDNNFEMTFCHEWLRRIGDALVDDLEPEQFIAHCRGLRAYQMQLTEMVADWHPTSRKSLDDFKQQFQHDAKGVHYFRASMFKDDDFERTLHQSLKETLLKAYEIKANQPGNLSARFHSGAPFRPKSADELNAMTNTHDILKCYGELINALSGMQKTTRNQITTLLETEQRFLQENNHGNKTIRRGTLGSLVSKDTIDSWCEALAVKANTIPEKPDITIGMHRFV